jgi:acyl carrier protein phosphodiesterase
MNHLAHFYLAGSDTNLLIGNFLGDYVKGRLVGERLSAIEAGIRLHRSIDAFTDNHPITRLSQSRFEPRFRRVSGIMTDIIYDHFLASEWDNYHQKHLQNFSDITFEKLLNNKEYLPDSAIKGCERMHKNNVLSRYVEPTFIDRSLRHLATRLSRDTPLAEGYGQFSKHREALGHDFREFFPLLQTFVNTWIRDRNQAERP